MIEGAAAQGLDRANWTHTALAEHLYRKLNPIERLWKGLRQRATHNRLFDTLAE